MSGLVRKEKRHENQISKSKVQRSDSEIPDNNRGKVIEFRCTINNDEAESYEKAVHTFESVQASLALDGYANLVIGEKTSLLGDKWWLEESKE